MDNNLETAQQRVERHLNAGWPAALAAKHGPLVVTHHIEKPYGWVFFYTCQKYLETRDFQYLLVGNGPIVFDRRTETLHQLGTVSPPDDQIRRWEADHLTPG
jgi:immunity protein 35 of polymorphic toxin system